MLLADIATHIAFKLTDIPLDGVVETLEAFFNDRKAFLYARETLRSKYAQLILPASYDDVVENMFLSKQDFIDYFRTTDKANTTDLEIFLTNRLSTRAAMWTHNTIDSSLLEQMLGDFYDAYVAHFLATDSAIVSLQVLGSIEDIKRYLDLLRRELLDAKRPEGTASYLDDLCHNLQVFLALSGVPFELLETSDEHCDIVFTDPSSILPIQSALTVYTKTTTQEHLIQMLERFQPATEYSHLIAVTADWSHELESYAKKRRIQLYSPEKFRSLFARLDRAQTFVVGEFVAKSLAKSLRINEVYIVPDIVRTYPGDDMELKFFSEREDGDSMLDNFLSDPASDILFVLGNYGSGKSAFAVHTLRRFCRLDSEPLAGLIALRDLRSADELDELTRRCAMSLRGLRVKDGLSLVILDGLDELPNAMDPEEQRRNIFRLLDASRHVDKLIVTVRVSYFRGLADFWRFFSRPGDTALWDSFAKELTRNGSRPNVAAVVLREFDTRQIQEYVRRVGSIHSEDGDTFLANYEEAIEQNDVDSTYVKLQRNPLYLYLLVHTRPWNVEGVACFGDVIEHFIDYWLQRDAEKGPSRWLLTTNDRKEFIDAASWWLFEKGRYTLGVNEFKSLVSRHFELEMESQDALALVLDLQTTGIFTSVGNTLTFSLRAYGDVFVAARFGFGHFQYWPSFLPDHYQARMWLGLVETRIGYSFFDEVPEKRRAACSSWMAKMGIKVRDKLKIDLDVNGILTDVSNEKEPWSRINGPECSKTRSVIHAALTRGAVARRSTLRADLVDEISSEITVALLINNKLGLHAKAAAIFVTELHKSMFGQCLSGKESLQTTVGVRRDGQEVNGFSIMGVMMLAASKGTVLEIRFKQARQTQVLGFLGRIKAKPEKDFDGIWVTDFGETTGAGGGVTYPRFSGASALDTTVHVPGRKSSSFRRILTTLQRRVRRRIK